jgi:hypothetical protein
MLARYESVSGRGSNHDRDLKQSVFFLANAFPKYTRNMGEGVDTNKHYKTFEAPSENQFYSKFVKKHQRGLERKFDTLSRSVLKDETLNDNERKEKIHIVQSFKQGLLKYLAERSPYRKYDADAFVTRKTLEANGYLKTEDRNKLLERYLTPVRALKPLNSDLYARKLKEANYGKWFLTPRDYNRKISVVNKKIKRTIDNSLA